MKRNLFRNISILFLAALSLSSCKKYLNPEPKFEDYEQEIDKTVKRKVLIISVDGLVGKELKKKVPTNIASLMKNGKYSFEALTDVNTSDPASWATMMTGYTAAEHRVITDSYLPAPSSDNPHGSIEFSPSIIYRMEDLEPTLKTSIVVQDEGVGNILLMDADDNILADNDNKVKEEAITLLRKKNSPDLLVVQFKDVLSAGKESDFLAEENKYAQAIESVDAKIGALVKAIESRGDKEFENWLIIITSSHGGSDKSYGGESFAERNIFTLYSQKYFSSQELKAETMESVFLNGYFQGTYNHYSYATNGITRTFPKIGVRAQSPAGAVSNVFNANSTPDGSITYDFKLKLREDNVWKGLDFTGGYAYWYNYFMGKDASADNVNAGWHLFGQNTNFTLRFQDGSKTESVEFGRGADGAWHHFSFVFRKLTNSTTNIRVYLDGVLSVSKDIAMGVAAFANTEPLTLGFNTQRTDLGYAHYDLSDFRVWNKGLSENEARSIACEKNIDKNNPLYTNLLAAYTNLSKDKWKNSIDNEVPDLTFSNTAAVSVSASYTPCEQAANAVFMQNIDLAPQIFYWLGLKISDNWGWHGDVFLSNFELEFLK